MNIDVLKAFMSHKKFHPHKTTADGRPIHMSFSHVRKYYDAILFGAYRANVPLPATFKIEMGSYIDSIKKEKIKARKKGELDDRDADPINFGLYKHLCQFALRKGDIFLWAFTVFQWNCMARSINIDDITFSQCSLGNDSLVIKYFDSKSDQTGERTSPKNCYANPFDYSVCIFTALGCYLPLNEESWASTKDAIFRNRGAASGTGSTRYCKGIAKLARENMGKIEEFVRSDHFKIHGIRKGSAIYATSGTTLPASLAAVANRGEWKVSIMFDIYLGFAEPGDQYLGRILAGLNVNDDSFAVLPPHFVCGMENELIREAINLCFGTILIQR